MGKTIATKFGRMRLRTKICIIFTLLLGGFLYQGILNPKTGDTVTNTYYFRTDSTAVNLGGDGSTTTSTSTTLNKKISMVMGGTPYATSRSVVSGVTSNAVQNIDTIGQTMIRVYGPLVTGTAGSKKTYTAPAVTIGVRDRNGTTNSIWWKAYVYDYNPAGAANNGVLLWSSDVKEAHPSVQTPLELTFTNPVPKDIQTGHRIKIVVKCQMASTASSARLYWGSSTNYSYFTVSEAPYVANSVTVNNLDSYYPLTPVPALTTVTQGDSNIPMLKLDLYSNVAGGASWTGGKLDRVGTNTSVYLNDDEPGDVTFSVYKDANGDGLFKSSDTLVGGPYRFDQLTGQNYILTVPQTITDIPARYFIVYNILRTATYNTTVGARIANSGYFTSDASGGVQNVISTTSSTPNIQFGGTAVTKNYPADWDTGTSLAGISESTGPNITDTTCIVRNTVGSGFPLVGLLNYPASSCRSVAGQGYSTPSAQADFARLYFGGAGYHSAIKTIKGGSFVYRVYTPYGGGTVTLRLFYVTSGGVRVNAPITSRYTTSNSVSQTITTSLAGQDFSNVPIGARLGIQIGVTANMRIGLGSSVGARLTVQETAAENENVDVGNGTTIANAGVYASTVGKVINSFTLSAAKAKTVNSIVVEGSAMFNSTNVKEVKIYADATNLTLYPNTRIGQLDANDTLVGSTTTVSGNRATISGLALAVGTKVSRFLVVVDICDSPNVNVILTALVSDLTVATTGGIGENIDSGSATLTILPTTTLGNFITTEPWSPTFSKIIPSGAAATKVDAFSLKTNGGMNDTIGNVTVNLSTTGSLPSGKIISDYVERVDIVTGSGVSIGHLTSPTKANNWQVSTPGFSATQTGVEYFVAITPKSNQNITCTVKARVTAVAHSRQSNELKIDDSDSATLILDQQPPSEPVLSAVTGTYGADADLAQINLDWIGSADASTNDSTLVSYILVRGLGNAPAPRSCTADNVKSFMVYQGTDLSVINKGLNEGASYGYRICSKDSVGNISFGNTKSATGSIKTRCNEIPGLEINPMASYIKAGESVVMSVNIINNNTGVCAATTFSLSIVGTDSADSNFTTSTFTANNFIIDTNKGSASTKLNITAKPGAVQGAIKTFHVKATKSTDGIFTQCTDPVYVAVNKFGTMIHSSMNIGTSKYGSWGKDHTCATCHSPNATNIKRVKNTIATPNGNRAVTFSIASTAASANVPGVFGNDNRPGTTSTNVCEVCHHNVRFHQYSTSKIAWKDHNNNSDCMACHPHSKGFKTVSTSGSCDDCHGNPPTTEAMLVAPPTNVLFSYATNAGSHEKHTARLVKCAACHSNGNHVTSAIPDAKLNMGFNIKASSFTGFVGNISTGTINTLPISGNYNWVGAAGTTIDAQPGTIMTCNVYCHGWSGDGGYNSEPAWTGISQVGCGSCHAANGNDAPTSGSHHKHASTEPGFGNGISCRTCHGFRNYTTSSEHINGNVEWDLSTITTTALYRESNTGSTGNKAPTAPGNYGTCKNLYCHSDVQSANGSGPPTTYSEVSWGGTTDCGSCHTEPNTSGGHSQHVAAGVTGFGCRICHAGGGDTSPLNHADEKIDFTFVGLGENTHYSYSSSKIPGSGAYGTCYNGNCHARKNIEWTGPNNAIPLCDKCHGTDTSSGGFYSTAGPGSTTSPTDPYVGAHFMHFTSLPNKRYAAKIGCDGCHLNPEGPYTPGHIDTALPAEIVYGPVASRGIQNGYTSAVHAPGYNSTTKECSNVWCHGGGMSSNQGIGPYGSAVYDGAALGNPAVPIWNVPFLNGTGANDCNKCHAFPPPAPLPGYMHYNVEYNRPYVANECIFCHNHLDNTGYTFKNPALHVDGIVDSCYTCHGRPPNDEAGLTIPAVGALTPGFAGAHQAHALNPSIGNDCYACHDNYSEEMPSYLMEMGFKAYSGMVASGTFYGYSTLSANYSPVIVYASSNAGTVVRRTNNPDKLNTCENLYCHGGSTEPSKILGGGSNIKPSWEGGSSHAACGSCHGVSGETYNVRGSHRVHVGTGYGQLRLSCTNCHGIKENNYHVDGKVEWEFYSTNKRLNLLIADPKYTPANGTAGDSGKTNNLAPSATYGTCTVYCHSDGKGTIKPVIWGGPALHCGSCHINQTSTFDGSHENHSKSTALGGYGIDCLICHSGSGSGSPMHVNGAIDVIFNTAVVGSSATWDKASHKCFSILCHDSNATTGPTWNVPSTGKYDGGTYKPTCIGCHTGEVGTRAAVIPQFAGESHHIQGIAMSNSYCYPCHLEAANTSGLVNETYHDRSANKPVELVIWSAGARGSAFTRYTASGSTTPARKRLEYTKLNNHCLSCHNAANAAITPFGDGKTPKAYAWDGTSVAERYSLAGTTLWGKVTGNNTAVKNNATYNTKAYSAHGRADLNKRGWAVGTAATGESYATNTSGDINVLCFDCHNSHGTSASGIMSSYSSATGRYKGGILKSTSEGIGGYAATYTPSAGGSADAPGKNAYNPGAALCFDCHNSSIASATVPWGYGATASGGTFNATQAIYGYHDTPYFGDGTFANTQTYVFKANNPTNKGGHFGAYTSLNTNSAKPINGLCTPCHDPHGVSPTLAANQQYAVPLLKGTWVTSPYKQDTAPSATNEVRGGGKKKSVLSVGSTPKYYIDQNTMGLSSGGARTAWTFPGTPTTLQSTTESQFAGLCTGCHLKADINSSAAATTANWKSMGRIHNTVKGWATATGGNANNSKHAFTCSKCHTAHNSRLPRLLVTNCLDAKHRGQAASGGENVGTQPITAALGQNNSSSGGGLGRFPQGGGGTGDDPLGSAGKWFFGKGLKITTRTAANVNTESQTLCHQTATSGGVPPSSGTPVPSGYEQQLWNTKTPW